MALSQKTLGPENKTHNFVVYYSSNKMVYPQRAEKYLPFSAAVITLESQKTDSLIRWFDIWTQRSWSEIKQCNERQQFETFAKQVQTF